MVVRIKSRRAIAYSVTVSAYARMYGVRTYRSCLLLFPFLPKRTYQVVQKHLRRRQRPQWPQVTKTSIGPRTRMDTLHNTVAIRMRWMRGAMTVIIRAVLDVVGDDGDDDESRRDGRRAARHFFRWQTVR